MSLRRHNHLSKDAESQTNYIFMLLVSQLRKKFSCVAQFSQRGCASVANIGQLIELFVLSELNCIPKEKSSQAATH